MNSNQILIVLKVQFSDNVMDVEDFTRVHYVANSDGKIIHKAVVNRGIYGDGGDFERLDQLHAHITETEAENDKGCHPAQTVEVIEVSTIRFSDFVTSNGISVSTLENRA